MKNSGSRQSIEQNSVNFIRLNTLLQFIAILFLGPLFLHSVRDTITALDGLLYVLMCLVAAFLVYAFEFTVIRLFSRSQQLSILSIGLATTIWMLLGCDAVLVYKLGVHLDSSVAITAISMLDFQIPVPILIGCAASFVAMICAQSFLWMRPQIFASPLLSSIFLLRRLLLYGFISGIALGVLEVEGDFSTVPTSAVPIYQSVVRLVHGFPMVHLRVSSSDEPKLIMQKKPHVLMMLAESFRWDLVSPTLTPNLYRLTQDHSCLVAQKSYAGGHLTTIGSFAYLYGSDGYLARPFFSARRKSPALSIFRHNGYKLIASDASGLLAYNPKVVQAEQFDVYNLHNEHHSAKNDADAVADAVKEFAETSPHQPVYTFIFLYSTHDPFLYPDNSPIPLPSTDNKGDHQETWEKFRRSAAYVDLQVGEALRGFQSAKGESDLVFSFAGDHGEEFGEHGGAGHAAVGFSDARARVPNILCFPKRPENAPEKITLSANADILPTILNWSGISETALRPYFSGKSFFTSEPRKFAILTGVFFPTDGRDFGVVDEQIKLRMIYANSGPATSEVVRVVDSFDQPLKDLPLRQKEIDSLLEKADSEFHRYLKVDGTVAGYAETSSQDVQH